MTPRQNRSGGPRTGAGSGPVSKYRPAEPKGGQWALGWEAGHEHGLHAPLGEPGYQDGWLEGFYSAMDERSPGWRTPVDDDDDDSA